MRVTTAGTEQYLARRATLLFGLLTSSAGIILGAIWPSVFTIAAVLILPAPFLFLWGIVRPKFVDRVGVRYYLISSAALAVACVVWEAIYLALFATWGSR